MSLRHAAFSTDTPGRLCNKWLRERLQWNIRLGHARRLPNYPLGMTALKDVTICKPAFVFRNQVEAARFRLELGNRLSWDVTVLFKTRTNFFTVCIGKSTFVLLTLLIPALGSPLSNHCCRCAGIALQNGCQVANRLTDVCGGSVIHGITSEISRQWAVGECALVNVKLCDSLKRGCFL